MGYTSWSLAGPPCGRFVFFSTRFRLRRMSGVAARNVEGGCGGCGMRHANWETVGEAVLWSALIGGDSRLDGLGQTRSGQEGNADGG